MTQSVDYIANRVNEVPSPIDHPAFLVVESTLFLDNQVLSVSICLKLSLYVIKVKFWNLHLPLLCQSSASVYLALRIHNFVIFTFFTYSRLLLANVVNTQHLENIRL